MIKKVKVTDIVYDKNIYPREKIDTNIIAQYQEAIEKLPPIVIDQKNRIIDGYHRVLAYRKEHVDEIDVELFDSENDKECLIESIRLNSTHGKQLSSVEKKILARVLYKQSCSEKEIKQILSVSDRTLSNYLSDLKDKEDEDRNDKILALYLACWTQDDIAKEVGISQNRISEIITNIGNGKLAETDIPPLSLQKTNLWQFSACDPAYGDKDYPGRMPGQIIENLLWCYTQPFDVVFDPMAGSGTTIDVCKKMYRRYIAYDINPLEHKGIKKNDILSGIPQPKIKDKPKLIVLDPPYSFQKKGEYTDEPNDLSNLSLTEFFNAVETMVKKCKKIIDKDGIIAFIISSIRHAGEVTDLPRECFNIIDKHGFKEIDTFCIPYSNTQSMTGYWLANAEKNKWHLRDYRLLYVGKLK